VLRGERANLNRFNGFRGAAPATLDKAAMRTAAALPPGQRLRGGPLVHPGRMKDGSRGSKRSETPGPASACVRIPESARLEEHAFLV